MGGGKGPYVFAVPERPEGVVEVSWSPDHSITDLSEFPNDFRGGSWTYTIDPTTTAEMLRVPLNHRASYRWVAAPGGELVWPATANNGIAGVLGGTTATDFSATMHVVGF